MQVMELIVEFQYFWLCLEVSYASDSVLLIFPFLLVTWVHLKPAKPASSTTGALVVLGHSSLELESKNCFLSTHYPPLVVCS
jgi:hypothetical protein